MLLNSSVSHIDRTTLSRLFELQAGKMPQQIALVFNEQSLTYQELNQRANQVAYTLRARYEARYGHALPSGILIGLCVERSLEMIIGLLGILKAGGAYLPLDPNYPEERLRFILDDTQTPMVLTEKTLFENLSFLGESKRDVLCIEANEELDKTALINPTSTNHPDDTAYVIYTSGTTGKPKGVLITHWNVQRLFAVTEPYFHFNEKDVWTLFHSYAFDFSVWEIWGALLYGGCLVIVPYLTTRDPKKFYHLLNEKRVTVLNQTPSAFQQLIAIDQQSSQDLSFLRYIVFGGEALNVFQLKPWWDKYTDKAPQLVNMYGITEITVHATYYALSRKDLENKQFHSPIGHRLTDLTFYILDEHLKPVSPGTEGELYIGGEGVSQGYLNRADLTAQRFLPNPFISQESQEEKMQRKDKYLYKTGDLVCEVLPEQLDYRGRADLQVKVRGFRIELGEIESVLAQYPGINQCVVTVRQKQEQKQLVAYYISTKQSLPSDFSVNTLRAHLSKQLPDYMVPAAFVAVEAFPLTSNGKIDRNALPDPKEQDVFAGTVYVAPRTSVEQKLTAIWQSILKLEHIGINDDFFALGGDSILSIQMISRAHEERLPITQKQFYTAPTIAELAAKAEQTIQTNTTSEQGLVQGEVPLTPIQCWFFNHNFLNVNHFNQAFLFRMKENLDQSLLATTLSFLCRQHDALRLRYHYKNKQWSQYFADESACSIPIHTFDLRTIKPEQQDIFIQQKSLELQSTLNIENGPTVCIGVFNNHCDNVARLLITSHHLLIDGVSWRILLNDLEYVYQQLKLQQPIHLPLKTHSYQGWGNALQQYANSKDLYSQLQYWLSVGQHSTSLSIDNEADMPLIRECGHKVMTLDAEHTRALLQQVPIAYHTQINDILLSALGLAMHRWRNLNDILLNLEGHGRETHFTDLDVSRTIGWFTTIFPVHLQLPTLENDTPEMLATLIKSIKEQLRAIPDKGFGYGALRYLNGTDNQTLFTKLHQQIKLSFNYLGQFDNSFSSKGLIQLEQNNLSEALPINFLDLNSPQNTALYLLDINGWITSGCLHMVFSYSRKHYQEKSIEQLAAGYKTALEQIIQHCSRCLVPSYTPSDFPLAKLNQAFLDGLAQPQSIVSIYGLSPLQEGLLFHSLYAPESDQYCTQVHWQYQGNLNRTALKQAWHELVARHAVLRTSFVWHNVERPCQIVHETASLAWHEEDWRGLTADEQQQKLTAYLASERQQPFDLNKAGLMRCHLIQFDDSSYAFIWSHHHILLDGWCVPILLDEISQRYEHIVRNQHLLLPVTPAYEKYIAWLYAQDKSIARQFWQKQLQDFSKPTSLVVNNDQQLDIRKPILHLGERSYTFSKELTDLCIAFAREHKVTLSTLLQLAWVAVLSQYNRQKDVVIGVTVSGRTAEIPHIERIIGLFINTLPLRMIINQQQNVIGHLSALHKTIQELNDYSFLSLNEIQQCSSVPSHLPLFYSLFDFENYPSIELSKALALKASQPKFNEKTNYPLTISVLPGKELLVKISYDNNCLANDSIERLLNHIHQALNWMINNPYQPLEQIQLITQHEEKQIIELWNHTNTEFSADKTLFGYFKEQVIKEPGAPAIISQDHTFSYKDVYYKANRIAHALKTWGAKPNQLVAILMEKGWEQIVACLAIIQSGAAYLPLDPDWPLTRIKDILQQGKVQIVLTQDKVKKRLFINESIQINNFAVDDETIWASYHNDSLPQQQTIDDIAYVIFTSGSTGKPKGVAISHRGVINTIMDINQRFAVNADDKILAVSNLSFDLSVYDIFGLLSVGGAIVIPEPQSLKEPADWIRWLQKEKITIWNTVPMLMQMLVDYIEQQPIRKNISPLNSNLRLVLLSGDWIPLTLPAKIKDLFPVKTVVSLGGATEASIWSILFPITTVMPDWKSIPYGQPMANQKLYVLNSTLKHCPVGVPGELYIGGVGVALGYWQEEEKTAASFIEHPQLGRLYKTGDLGRWQPEGTIEFLGRLDNQVKIGGYRIELGEIETILSKHPAISQCAVVMLEHKNRKQLIAAYYVLQQKSQSTDLAETLRTYLAGYLPSYMLPTFFICLEILPLTANGKIDRKALPVPDAIIETNRDTISLQPRNTIESQLQKIWTSLFQEKEIHILDDFFLLGGHSLLAVRLVVSINEHFNLNLPVAWVFSNPTIEKQAYAIQQQSGQVNHHEIFAFNSLGNSSPLFFVHPGQGGAEAYFELAKLLNNNQPFYAIESYLLSCQDPHSVSIETLASHYIRHLQKLRPVGPYCLGGWSLGGLIAYEMGQQLIHQGYEVKTIYLLDTFLLTKDEAKSYLSFNDIIYEILELEGFYQQLPPHYRLRVQQVGERENKAMVAYKAKPYAGNVVLLKASNKWEIPSNLKSNQVSHFKDYMEKLFVSPQ